jgi:hypothetical protein
MSFAVVVRVSLDPNSDTTHRHAILNEIVIPDIRALPGFEKATWMNNGAGTGTSIVVFSTEAHARAAIPALTPAVGPVVLECEVHEIEIEAGPAIAGP